VRVASWNILSGKTVDGSPAPPLADQVSHLDVDVLALQEVDHRMQRSGAAEQPRDAALGLNAIDWRFAPSYAGQEDEPRIWTPGVLHGPTSALPGPHYGIALLSRIPVRRWHRLELGSSPIGLPLLYARDGQRRMKYVSDEPHQAIAAELENGWTAIATHLSFVPPINMLQLRRIRLWAKQFGRKVFILGDLNLTYRFLPLGPLWRTAAHTRTYPSWKPVVQFDHVLIRRGLKARKLKRPKTELSDHLPVLAEIRVS
jgi:endonuclease/exonuclease/phosphatase family metal-dependent hydrolase